jgi:hypothetical protein
MKPKTMPRLPVITMLAALSSCLVPLSATAQVYLLEISGTIAGFEDRSTGTNPYSTNFNIGDTWNASFTIDTSIAATPESGLGNYADSITDSSLSVDGFDFGLWYDYANLNDDSDYIGFSINSTTDLDGESLHYGGFRFVTGTSTLGDFIDAFDSGSFSMSGTPQLSAGGGADQHRINFSVASASISAVPEPSTYAAMLGFVTIAIVIGKRHRRPTR